jgi:hypothetical protein
MTETRQRVMFAAFVIATAVSAGAQTSPSATVKPPAQAKYTGNLLSSGFSSQQLFALKDSEVKFDLRDLMNTLRDHRHEGWVLAAYPDPKTSRPLIGAGFSLDVEATEHPQYDSLNPHLFVEPSSAQLWQAAGLDPERLREILDQYDLDLQAWTKKKYRKKIVAHKLTPQLTEEEATSLLRISAIQATYNARAYCRNFDQLTASQQMALSQLVFQMGINLEEFVEFLNALNGDGVTRDLSQPDATAGLSEVEHWKAVQRALIDSQWARHYSDRATAVIAMFDPEYLKNPHSAEERVEAILGPTAVHRHKSRSARSVQVASNGRHAGKASKKKASRS